MSEVAAVDQIQAIRGASTLDELYRISDRLDLTPGWVRREIPILWREPRSDFRPAYWRYDQCKAALDAAGRLIDVSLAERRNLVLRNPLPGNNFATARTLVCAYQMILPGETAPSHRHVPHALRVILDAKGSYSVVNGAKTPMETGDVVLTPGWCWHSHGHDGDEPAYWLDGLDVPLTHLLEPMFFEPHPDHFEKVVTVVTESPFRFTWASIQRGLDQAKPDPEGFYGVKINLAAPDMPTLGIGVQRLSSGQMTRRHRTTVNQFFCVMDGRGETIVNGEVMKWSRGDAFIVPCWNKHAHHADSDATLFMLSDEPLMRFARYFRLEAD